jgi:hypothetical protein
MGRSGLTSKSAIDLHSARSHEFQEAHSAVSQRLLDAQQRGVFAGTFGRIHADSIPQTRKSAHGMLGIIIVPRHAIVIQESEQLVRVFFNSLLKRESGLRCAFHGDNALDESCGRFSVLAQLSRFQAMCIYRLNDPAEQRGCQSYWTCRRQVCVCVVADGNRTTAALSRRFPSHCILPAP